jgi:hypothetical protein
MKRSVYQHGDQCNVKHCSHSTNTNLLVQEEQVTGLWTNIQMKVLKILLLFKIQLFHFHQFLYFNGENYDIPIMKTVCTFRKQLVLYQKWNRL